MAIVPLTPVMTDWLETVPSVYRAVWDIPNQAGAAVNRYRLEVPVQTGTLCQIRVSSTNNVEYTFHIFQTATAARNSVDHILLATTIPQVLHLTILPIIFSNYDGPGENYLYVEVDGPAGGTGVLELALDIQHATTRGGN
jgi:hypothetical protein